MHCGWKQRWRCGGLEGSALALLLAARSHLLELGPGGRGILLGAAMAVGQLQPQSLRRRGHPGWPLCLPLCGLLLPASVATTCEACGMDAQGSTRCVTIRSGVWKKLPPHLGDMLQSLHAVPPSKPDSCCHRNGEQHCTSNDATQGLIADLA